MILVSLIKNKRGIAFVFAFVMIMVLLVLSSSFYLRNVSDANLIRRSTESMRAFWLAEAGVAEGLQSLTSSSLSGSLTSSQGCPAGYSCLYTSTQSPVSAGSTYYQVNASGTVTTAAGQSFTRVISVVANTNDINASKFPYAIETTSNLTIKGSVSINPSNSSKTLSILNFANLFEYSKTEVKSFADHLYSNANFTAPVDNITWVDVIPGSTLTIAGNLVGSGLMVISGDTHISGTVNFTGIIYVIGNLTITGTVDTHGSVLAESSTTVDTTIKGNVDLTYNATAINAALANLNFVSPEVVSWREN
jgi:Tfp pilus assembly protein PilX